jgi:hypothetical protein
VIDLEKQVIELRRGGAIPRQGVIGPRMTPLKEPSR